MAAPGIAFALIRRMICAGIQAVIAEVELSNWAASALLHALAGPGQSGTRTDGMIRYQIPLTSAKPWSYGQ